MRPASGARLLIWGQVLSLSDWSRVSLARGAKSVSFSHCVTSSDRSEVRLQQGDQVGCQPRSETERLWPSDGRNRSQVRDPPAPVKIETLQRGEMHQGGQVSDVVAMRENKRLKHGEAGQRSQSLILLHSKVKQTKRPEARQRCQVLDFARNNEA